MQRHLTVLALLLVGALSAACGDSSPTSPSGSSNVTVNGSIVSFTSGAGSQSARTSSVASATVPGGIKVKVAGTNIIVDVSPEGTFTLRNVPSGNVILEFSGAGTSATITLTDLQSGETVTLNLTLSGSTAQIESDRRSRGREEQLEGRVESLPPTTLAGELMVAGRTVRTNATTVFRLGNDSTTFAALALGQRVHVKGETDGLVLVAREVKIQNTNTSTGLNVNGVVSGFSGTRSAFQFTVNGVLVKGDAATEFFGNSVFQELANGATVEVKASQRDGFVYATRIHVETEDIEFSSVISAKTGTAPNLTLTIGSHTVLTTSETDVKRKGDDQTVAQLQIGQTVEVSGRLLADGKVIARKIEIVSDAVGGLFEMEGNMGGSSGSCPTLTFSVSGYVIKTDSLTAFTPSCGSLNNGSKVKVVGVVQADLSVKATSVQKQ